MKRFLTFVIAVFLLASFISCGAKTPSARELLLRFTQAYGASGILYSPEIAEGEAGYTDTDFFFSLYGDAEDTEGDYAVFLSSSLDAIYEAAVFVTMDKSSEIYAERLCRERIGLLTKMGYGEGAILIKRKNTLFYSTLSDACLAERIWLEVDI